MKKVRFESPININRMNDFECHSPRPFIDEPLDRNAVPYCFEEARILSYSSDPLIRYEQSDSIPIPLSRQTEISGVTNIVSRCLPSSDLDLSMLDGSNLEPRRNVFKNVITNPDITKNLDLSHDVQNNRKLSADIVQNHAFKTYLKDNSFFIKRDNLANLRPINSLQNGFNKLSFDKENNPLVSKAEMMKNSEAKIQSVCQNATTPVPPPPLKYFSDMANESDCNCHHCLKVMQRKMTCLTNENTDVLRPCNKVVPQQCNKMLSPPYVQQESISPVYYQQKSCNCDCKPEKILPKNAVNKKTWAIERYEKNKDSQTMEIEKQINVSKEKREPTVADLYKIIKLQNEQLQLLQEKVDKFISVSKNQPITNVPKHQQPITNNPVPIADTADRKISIGVMTSFEMVCTSTVLNKEIFKSTDTAQIQCNRSQISIKEVVSKTPMNKNFLDGLRPARNTCSNTNRNNATIQCKHDIGVNTSLDQISPVIEEKTLNEQSLYNVQVDNATTPLMSPEQTLYLDVRDYSDSDSSSYNQSNVGWTYYNKVMTHVNGVLQDSDMPSSASAMYRNMRQQCMQMHAMTDKTNISVTKRVQFGEDILISRPTQINTPVSTDTSLRMNQLAAKYLKDSARPFTIQQATPKQTVSNDMSLATKNYMERHHILQGQGTPAKTPYTGEMPRFLDITALKQQPKLL